MQILVVLFALSDFCLRSNSNSNRMEFCLWCSKRCNLKLVWQKLNSFSLLLRIISRTPSRQLSDLTISWVEGSSNERAVNTFTSITRKEFLGFWILQNLDRWNQNYLNGWILWNYKEVEKYVSFLCNLGDLPLNTICRLSGIGLIRTNLTLTSNWAQKSRLKTCTCGAMLVFSRADRFPISGDTSLQLSELMWSLSSGNVNAFRCLSEENNNIFIANKRQQCSVSAAWWKACAGFHFEIPFYRT